mgnify:CR=1 FL=1
MTDQQKRLQTAAAKVQEAIAALDETNSMEFGLVAALQEVQKRFDYEARAANFWANEGPYYGG